MNIKTKDLQRFLRSIKLNLEELDYKRKFNINMTSQESMLSLNRTYRTVKNTKLRGIRFKLWHNDIFSHFRMKKFNMTDTDKCPRCGMVEDTQHQLFECKDSKFMWKLYNNIVTNTHNTECKIENFADVLFTRVQDTSQTELIKTVIIKLNIQIIRPRYNIQKILNEIIRYVRIEIGNKNNNDKRWENLLQVIEDMKTQLPVST
jgi:hypothetical protein